VPTEWEAAFAAVEGEDAAQCPEGAEAPELHIPPPNVLIPEDFSVIESDQPEPTAPEVVRREQTHVVWYVI
jgi:secreted Zn-dependent insulinase-like peptidase